MKASDAPPAFAERFLELPDLFPARASGEPLGPLGVSIGLPGGPYRVDGLGEEELIWLQQQYRGLCSAEPEDGPEDGAGAETVVRVFRVSADDFRKFDLAGWVHTLDFDYQPHQVRVAGLNMMGLIELDRPGGLVASYFLPPLEREHFLPAFENLSRVVVAYRLLQTGGLLLHSAGLAFGNRAGLFVGKSGAGKSTLVRLATSSGAVGLSDDLNVLQRVGGMAVTQPLPFAGDHRVAEELLHRTLAVPAVYRLEQARRHQIVDLSPARSLASLVASAPSVNCDPHRASDLERVAEELLEVVAVRQLDFAKDPGFLDLAEFRQHHDGHASSQP